MLEKVVFKKLGQNEVASLFFSLAGRFDAVNYWNSLNIFGQLETYDVHI